MSLLDTLNPAYLPDLSKAKKIKGYASLGDKAGVQFDHWLKKKAKDEVKKKEKEKASRESAEKLRLQMIEARKDYAYRQKIYEEKQSDSMRARRAMLKARAELNNRIRSFRRANESLQNLSGNTRLAELESLHVVEKAEVSTSLQQTV